MYCKIEIHLHLYCLVFVFFNSTLHLLRSRKSQKNPAWNQQLKQSRKIPTKIITRKLLTMKQRKNLYQQGRIARKSKKGSWRIRYYSNNAFL